MTEPTLERHELSVPGRVGGTGRFQDVRSPFDGELVGRVELADAVALEHALVVQQELFADRSRWLPPAQRIEILRRTATIMGSRAGDLALLIAREGGKPLTDARVEVDRAIDGTRYLADEIARDAGPGIPMGATPPSAGRVAFTLREPIGIVAAVSAFNHPLNLIVHQVGPALAAGCPVIVKPAPPTPLSCLAFVGILREAGLPSEWCIPLPCENDVAEKLVTSDRIAFFSFIGSARVGWKLRSMLAPGVRCALEHGGAAPLIVDASADLQAAVPAIIKGGFYHAGQVCVSVQRVYVHRSRKDELVEALVTEVRALRTGDPTLPQTQVGPLIRPSEVERIDEWVREAVASGATVASGGKPLPGHCYAPTVLVDPPDDSKLMQLEVFGPVVSVVAFDDLEEAVSRANGVPWAFQAAVFASDLDRALYVASRLDATGVMVNDHTAFRVDWMPFGGRRQSGLGLGGLPFTLHDLTQPKMVVVRSPGLA
ncbi:MAG: aldehyde dehydrogenase family protein [Myxococcota bacterium]